MTNRTPEEVAKIVNTHGQLVKGLEQVKKKEGGLDVNGARPATRQPSQTARLG